MSEKKIVVPQGMLAAAYEYCPASFAMPAVRAMLEAALLWASQHPLYPTIEQQFSLHDSWPRSLTYDEKSTHPIQDQIFYSIVEWQRIAFLAPEPEVPEEVKDLLVDIGISPELSVGRRQFNGNIVEAFRRGQKSTK